MVGWRMVFGAAAAVNFSVAAALAVVPGPLIEFLALPPPGSPFYPQLLAILIAGFGLGYLLLARNPGQRAMALTGGVGKLATFALILAYWLLGLASIRLVALGSTDLGFGVAFLVFCSQHHRDLG